MAPGPTWKENKESFIGIMKHAGNEGKKSYLTIGIYVAPLNYTFSNG